LRARGARRLAGAILALAAAAACSSKAPIDTLPDPGRPVVGLYRAELRGETGRARHFRVWLWAHAPDRLHGEVLTPVGSTAVIFDGGGERVAVTIVRDATAFVGTPTAEHLERVFGLRVTLDRLVEALLFGATEGPDLSVRREGSSAPGLPSRIELSAPGRRLTLKRLRLEPLAVDEETLGSGRPPSGVELRALAELEPGDLPADGGQLP